MHDGIPRDSKTVEFRNVLYILLGLAVVFQGVFLNLTGLDSLGYRFEKV